jgi:hypothetical protein
MFLQASDYNISINWPAYDLVLSQFLFKDYLLYIVYTGDMGSIPGLGRAPGEGKGYPLQYSGPENSMDCIDHEVTKSWTRLSDFHLGI